MIIRQSCSLFFDLAVIIACSEGLQTCIKSIEIFFGAGETRRHLNKNAGSLPAQPSYKETIMLALKSAAANPLNKSKGISLCYPDVVHFPGANLPTDPDSMNDLRAQRADDVMAAYNRGHGYNEEQLEAMAGIASNFAHWCDRNGLTVVAALQLGASFYREETGGMGRQFEALGL
jgi:hypothetical protein